MEMETGTALIVFNHFREEARARKAGEEKKANARKDALSGPRGPSSARRFSLSLSPHACCVPLAPIFIWKISKLSILQGHAHNESAVIA